MSAVDIVGKVDVIRRAAFAALVAMRRERAH